MDKDPYSENQERPVYPANVVVSTLPRYEPRNIDETRQRKDFEIILNQALDLSPENIPIDLFQIDTRLPYEYYPYIKSVLSIYPKGIDPVSEITVFNAIWGKIGIEQLPWSVSMKIKEHPGYIVHLSVPEEEFSNAVNYLSYAYNRDRVDSPFNHRRLKHTEERDPQNYTITHTFIDGGVTHKVILHLKNETQDLFIPQKEEILPSAEMPIIQPLPKRSVFDNPNEFYIDDFPSMEGDKREREEILRTFIETASSFLNLGSFKLEYDKKKIYTNNDLETFPKELEVGPLLISYTDKSQD